jgi:hypothetical protein
MHRLGLRASLKRCKAGTLRLLPSRFRSLGIVLVLVVVLVLGALAFCAGKTPIVLPSFCSVSLTAKHSDSWGRARFLNFGV